MKLLFTLFFLCLSFISITVSAENKLWGGAVAQELEYKPQKVVYDVNVKTLGAMNGVLDRASYLSKITGADPFDSSIVLVLHGPEIEFFARENYKKYKELVHRAQSLVEGETLKIRMCKLAAEGHGYKPNQIHGFINVVPMGDAEIIRLQNEEQHAYMQ
ncbi:MAG: DsrE family protein [Gammaproteobacteria bacterium]|nr:DsrE family protein [Gammaproteobacteria bacterium]